MHIEILFVFIIIAYSPDSVSIIIDYCYISWK